MKIPFCRRSLGWVVAFAFGILTAASAVRGAEGADWKIGFGRVKITPTEPVPMSGYASRKEPFQDVGHDLWAKAMAFEDREGNRGVIVTLDLLGIFEPWSGDATRRIGEATGLKRDEILLSCSHTHAGPLYTVPSWVEGEMRDNIERYLDELGGKVARAAIEAVKNRRPASLGWGRGFAPFVMNRREFTENGVRLGTQFSGLADRTLPVLVARDDDGEAFGVLFQVACHATTLTGRNFTIGGDYPGFAQKFIEKEHPGVQAMFMAGCGGDANPYPRGTMEHAEQHGETTGREVSRLLEEKLTPVQGPLTTVFATVDLPLDTRIDRKHAEEMSQSRSSYQRYVGSKMLEMYERGEEPPKLLRAAPLAVWQFGGDLTLVALSGEVVVDYVKMLEDRLGPLKLWVAAYSNMVFGYLPSKRVLREGGYETRGIYRGGPGLFAPQAEEVVVDSIEQMARQAGREF